MTDNSRPTKGFDDFTNGERIIYNLDQRVRKIEDRLRDVEWECKLGAKAIREMEPVIDAAKDQDYLRRWIEQQERREAKRAGFTWTRLIGLTAALAAWTAAVVGIVALVLHH